MVFGAPYECFAEGVFRSGWALSCWAGRPGKVFKLCQQKEETALQDRPTQVSVHVKCSKHSSGPNVDDIAACEHRKLVSEPKEVFTFPTHHYTLWLQHRRQYCKVFCGVKHFHPSKWGGFSFFWKYYMNCYEIAGMGESNYRAAERAGMKQKGKVKLHFASLVQ